MKSTISAIMGVYNREAPGVAVTTRGLTPQELAVMPPHDTADDCIRVPLHSTKYPNLFALIDAADAELVNQYRWNPRVSKSSKTVYASAVIRIEGKSRNVEMQQLIMGTVGSSMEVDHVNRYGLDNRRSNLRICTHTQNLWNAGARSGTKSRFKGVTWHTRTQRWRARIYPEGREVSLGLYDTEIDAATAYDAAAREIYGEFAALNFPRGTETSAITSEKAA